MKIMIDRMSCIIQNYDKYDRPVYCIVKPILKIV